MLVSPFIYCLVLASPAIPVLTRPHIIIKIKVVFDVPATQPPKPLWEGGRCFSDALHMGDDKKRARGWGGSIVMLFYIVI